MKDEEAKPLNYAPPAPKERFHIWDMSLADWVIAFIMAVVVVLVLGSLFMPRMDS